MTELLHKKMARCPHKLKITIEQLKTSLGHLYVPNWPINRAPT